jgi:PAS domain S-box-containing protein
MNPAATRISGYSVEELTMMRGFPEPIVYEPDRERVMQAFESAVQGSTGIEQFRLKHKDGRTLWAEMTWQPIYDEKGNPLGHRESIRDVTARKLAESAAELAEQEKEAILDSMDERILHLDADNSILWANQAACDEIGLVREEIIGRLCEEVQADWHEPWGAWPAVQAMEAGRHIEVERTSAEGRTWFIQASPVRDRHGDTIGGVEIALDVSRYKRSEEAQQSQQEYNEVEAETDAGDPTDERE